MFLLDDFDFRNLCLLSAMKYFWPYCFLHLFFFVFFCRKGQAKRRRGSDCLSTCIDRPKVGETDHSKLRGWLSWCMRVKKVVGHSIIKNILVSRNFEKSGVIMISQKSTETWGRLLQQTKQKNLAKKLSKMT